MALADLLDGLVLLALSTVPDMKVGSPPLKKDSSRSRMTFWYNQAIIPADNPV